MVDKMKVNSFTKMALAVRKERRDMERMGWEEVDEGGGKLWELERGGRWNQTIKEVKISCTGKSLWVKISKGENRET